MEVDMNPVQVCSEAISSVCNISQPSKPQPSAPANVENPVNGKIQSRPGNEENAKVDVRSALADISNRPKTQNQEKKQGASSTVQPGAKPDEKTRKKAQDQQPLQVLLEDHDLCPDYADDIHEYLMGAESEFLADPQYMKNQTEIKPYMRTILLDWLVEVAQEFRLQSDTLFLAVNYYDRFLSKTAVTPDHLQLVGITCLWIAAKYEEIHPPHAKACVAMTDHAYTIEQMLHTEQYILSTLEFRLTAPTAKTFLRKLAQYAPAESNELYYMSCYLLELSLLDYDLVGQAPSVVAASAMHLALLMFRWPSWTPELESVSQYRPHQFLQCSHRLALLHSSEASSSSKSSVYRKWAGYDNSSIAKLPSLQLSDLVKAAAREHR